MNMISTGAFLNEMDASSKQSSAAKKFAAVWEKKNAKAARAGGVSLMALSLAACGGSSSTSTTTTSTDTTTSTTPATDAAMNLLLTKSSVTGKADDVDGGSGDDFINGKLEGSFEAGDTIDGGAGTDTLHIQHGAITTDATIDGSEVSNVENIIVDFTGDDGAADTLTLDLAGFSGVEKVTAYHVTSAGTSHDPILLISGSNFKTTVDVEIVGGDADVDGDAFDLTATYQSVTGTADSSNLLLNGAGANVVDIAGIETLNITATSTDTTVSAKGYSDINTLNATSAKTINISADSKITIGAIDAAAAVTIDSSDSAGVVVLTGETAATSTTVVAGSGKTTFTTATTGTLKFTGGAAADTLAAAGGNSEMTVDMGAGDDTVTVGAGSNLTAADTVAGGDGEDTLVVTDATFDASFKTTIKEATGFEILATTTTDAKSFVYSGVSNYDHLEIQGASNISAAATNVAGTDNAALTGIAAGDKLTITDVIQTGGDGGLSSSTSAGGAGGDGIDAAPATDGAADLLDIVLVGNADISGGDGGAIDTSETDDASGGDGGVGINATDFEALKLHIVSNADTADTITISGGSGGAVSANDTDDTAGDDGSDILLGTNATVTLTDALTESTNAYSKVNLGTVEGTNVIIDGSELDGALTVTTKDGNTTIKGGSKGDTLKGGAGADTITGGAGNDDIQGNAGKDTMTGGAGKDTFSVDENAATSAQTAVTDIITDFEIGVGTDTIDMVNTTTRISDASGTDVSGAVSGTSDLKASVSNGIVTLSGAGVSLVDTVGEVIDIFELLDATNGTEYGAVIAMGNTYVIGADSNDYVEEVIQLTGLTTATSISTTDADATIFIA